MTKLAEVVPTLLEVCRVARLLPTIETERSRQGIPSLVATLRRHGRCAAARGTLGRRRLRRAIRWVDRCMTDGGNCYRRALLEMALDRRAACEPLFLGFYLDGEQLQGHAWLDAPGERSGYQFSVQV